jgi:hypothetical protein
MTHIAEVVLPNSLAYLEGYVFSKGIIPLRKDVDRLTKNILAINKWEDAISNWKVHTVTPELNAVTKFVDYFTKNYLPAINTLRDWLAHPGKLAQFIAGPIIAPLVGQLGTSEHTVGRDGLSLLLVRAWDDNANPVWEAILQFVVAPK